MLKPIKKWIQFHFSLDYEYILAITIAHLHGPPRCKAFCGCLFTVLRFVEQSLRYISTLYSIEQIASKTNQRSN